MATETRTQDTAALLARAEEIKYLGTQYAMNGLTPPPELEAEFEQIQEALRRGQEAARAAPRPRPR
jgi:hypothetical protein